MCASDIISEISLTLKDTYIWTKYQKIVIDIHDFSFQCRVKHLLQTLDISSFVYNNRSNKIEIWTFENRSRINIYNLRKTITVTTHAFTGTVA